VNVRVDAGKQADYVKVGGQVVSSERSGNRNLQ